MKLFTNWYLNSWNESFSVRLYSLLEEKPNYPTNEINSNLHSVQGKVSRENKICTHEIRTRSKPTDCLFFSA